MKKIRPQKLIAFLLAAVFTLTYIPPITGTAAAEEAVIDESAVDRSLINEETEAALEAGVPEDETETAAVTPFAADAVSFTISSKGYGHNVGMSQYGAKGMAEAGYTYDNIIKYYYTGVTVASYSPTYSTIKVGLSSSQSSSRPKVSSATLTSSDGFNFGAYNSSRVFSQSGSTTVTAITVSSSGSTITVKNSGGTTLCTATGNLAIVPKSATDGGTAYAPASGTSGSYYGGFEFTAAGGTMTVINYVGIEDYVKGVVPNEMPASWNAEALKAQSLCARTYAAYNINKHNSSYGYDVCTSTDCQVYNGVYTNSTYKTKVNDAVAATAGQYILYNGSLIGAYYHAASGGATENSENVWISALAYLKGVKDTYESTPSGYTFSGTYTAAQFYTKMKAQDSTFTLADIAKISCTYTAMGNIKSVIFTDSKGATKTYTNEACRTKVLRAFTSYTSQRFTITSAGATGRYTDVAASSWYYKAVEYVADAGLFAGTSSTAFSPSANMTRGMFVTVLGRLAGANVSGYYYSGSITGSNVNFRSGPGTSYGTVTGSPLSKGASVKVLEKTTGTDKAAWYKIICNGQTGYVRGNYLSVSGGKFSDVPVAYYTPYVEWAAKNGIIDGYGGGKFGPGDSITREQMCQIMYTYSKVMGITLKTSSVNDFSDIGSVSAWAQTAVRAIQSAGIISGVGNNTFAPKKTSTRAEVAQVFMGYHSAYYS